ncbi:MAG TPA: T9SS type A sorting domain-containing protein [Ignavibacteria bacterium]|nr:T9SS type A sorting domain-containing protein [Ignavibacteria bacterium]
MKNLFITCLLFIISSTLLSQVKIDIQVEQYAAYYTAKVVASSGLPIPSTLITADGADSTYSNSRGKFVLGFSQSVFSDSQTVHPLIRFSNPYFQEYSQRITISKGDSLAGSDIILREVKPVIVTGYVYYGNKEMHPQINILFYGLKLAGSSFWAYPDSNGKYSIRIFPQPYYILCTITYGFHSFRTSRKKYYNAKPDLSTADVLVVQKDTSGIDFTFPSINTGTISGKVIDKISQQPISNAGIALAYDETSDSSFTGTDQNGNYSMEVLEGDYFLHAYKGGYFQQFYKDAHYTFDAKPVVVDSNNLNVTGVDFSLIKQELGSNGIVGFVKDNSSGTSLSNVEVNAIPLSGGIKVESKSDINGRYELSQMVNGEYILLFSKKGYNSEYYNNVNKWEDSFVFNLNGNKFIDADDVSLTQVNPFGGVISGKISSGSDSLLSGALVSAINTSDSTISTSISTYNGGYTIPSLVNNDYVIQASKIKYKTTQYPVKIEIDMNSQPTFNGANIAINAVNITDIKDKNNKTPSSFTLFQNYPNPFNPVTTISYSIPNASFVTIIVYDVMGREVATLIGKNELPGEHSVNFDASNLSSGIYLYQLKVVPVSSQAGDFLQARKMILLK